MWTVLTDGLYFRVLAGSDYAAWIVRIDFLNVQFVKLLTVWYCNGLKTVLINMTFCGVVFSIQRRRYTTSVACNCTEDSVLERLLNLAWHVDHLHAHLSRCVCFIRNVNHQVVVQVLNYQSSSFSWAKRIAWSRCGKSNRSLWCSHCRGYLN